MQYPNEWDKDKIPDLWFINMDYFKKHYKGN